jgi:hypothetical protein
VIEGERLEDVEENSRWEAELGAGVEVSLTLERGGELFVIQTALEDVDEEMTRWEEERMGETIEEADEIVDIPLETGGRQITYDITLSDGFTFEGDLLEDPDRVDYGDEKDTETEWAFEGTPGVEMGEQDTESTERDG